MLLTYCCFRSVSYAVHFMFASLMSRCLLPTVPYAVYLTLISVMVGCYLRTAASVVFLTQCTLRLHLECRAPYAYMCNGWVLLTLWLGATYALLLPQCSIRGARRAPYAYMCNSWVLLTHYCFRSVPYAVHFTFECRMPCILRLYV